MIKAYYKLELLSDEVRQANKIRSKKRRDCTFFCTPPDRTEYKGLTNFVNNKGQLYFYLTPARDFIKANSKRLADYSLTSGSQNFSSIYFEDIEFPNYGYGYPNSNRLLSNGEDNPQYRYKNDCYLFLVNRDYSVIEILVIEDGRYLVSSYYQVLIDGGLDVQLSWLRKNSKPFYDYGLNSKQ